MTLYSLYLVGQRFSLGIFYNISLVNVAGLFCYQQVLIRYREPAACFKAFLNNQWVGAVVFVGISLDITLK
jgi:4-hydroxybenzoate polyprenyltransferase